MRTARVLEKLERKKFLSKLIFTTINAKVQWSTSTSRLQPEHVELWLKIRHSQFYAITRYYISDETIGLTWLLPQCGPHLYACKSTTLNAVKYYETMSEQTSGTRSLRVCVCEWEDEVWSYETKGGPRARPASTDTKKPHSTKGKHNGMRVSYLYPMKKRTSMFHFNRYSNLFVCL